MIWLIRAWVLLIAMVPFALVVRDFRRAVRQTRAGRILREHLRASGARVLRDVPCRFEGPWWWLAWGTKWAWRRIDLWLTPSGVVMAYGKRRDAWFTHLAPRGAALLPGQPLRRDIDRAELFGDEVRFFYADGTGPDGAAFVARPASGVERESLCAAYSGAIRVDPGVARTGSHLETESLPAPRIGANRSR